MLTKALESGSMDKIGQRYRQYVHEIVTGVFLCMNLANSSLIGLFSDDAGLLATQTTDGAAKGSTPRVS